MLTEYLYNLKIRPATLLASALLYGIKTDTMSFERDFIDPDMAAFKYLAKYTDHAMIKRIVKSEFHLNWVQYISRAFYKMRHVNTSLFAHMGNVESPDLLVIVADFYMRVQGVPWIVISGVYEDQLVLIFRGDGLRKDMGKIAASTFSAYGSAGGHSQAARAEIPLEVLDGQDPEMFLLKILGGGSTHFRPV